MTTQANPKPEPPMPIQPYHPDPEINAEITAEMSEAEHFDLSAGLPARWWHCPECGASHQRGFLPVGTNSHRCLKCGYVGNGGVLLDQRERPIASPASAAVEPVRKVCLCGSSKHPDLHMRVMMEETLKGNIVIPMGLYGHADFPKGAKDATNDGDEATAVKQMLDRLHFRKIELADEVIVVTQDSYVGSSTQREIRHAESLGKSIRFVSFPKPPPAPSVEPSPEVLREIPITFYELKFYMFSNFSSFAVEYDGRLWPTSEHAYQAMKFLDHELQEVVRRQRSAHEAMKLAQSMPEKYRVDWPEYKVPVMLEICRAKLAQHPYIQRKLKETRERKLVESSPIDSFWGWGPNKDGQNHLGKIWMQLRKEPLASEPRPPSTEAPGDFHRCLICRREVVCSPHICRSCQAADDQPTNFFALEYKLICQAVNLLIAGRKLTAEDLSAARDIIEEANFGTPEAPVERWDETPRTDAVTGHCVCNSVGDPDVVPRKLAVELEQALNRRAHPPAVPNEGQARIGLIQDAIISEFKRILAEPIANHWKIARLEALLSTPAPSRPATAE